MVKMTLKIEGMSCGMCEAHLNDAVRRSFKVKKVASSHARGDTVIVAEQAPDEQKLREVIGGMGYTVLGVEQEPYAKKGLFGFAGK